MSHTGSGGTGGPDAGDAGSSGTGGIGPIEPGEGTAERLVPLPRPPRALAFLSPSRRRLVLPVAFVAASAGGLAGYLWARPAPAPPAEPLPPAAPSQRVSLRYGDPVAATSADTAFAFTVRIRTSGGPPVTVEAISQPSRALGVTIRPTLPVVVATGEAREVIVEIRVADCVHVARNSGLPFLEVTLSNERQKEAHSYILGDRYAADLSAALTTACPADRDRPLPEKS
ncbi:Tat pathway signal sequence domain protein [Streptomyces sp. NPDC002054]|uniref:Tat pathway signal sequence domain protein n=1 Tax=Streptomyces sp. NPDC002054 TaxID=3154663 RepID=UPI00332C629D